MTKPQVSAEPSMEDILASIRKMISEERMGPRPIPDQMSRNSFSEGPALGRSVPSAPAEARPDPRAEARADQRPDAHVGRTPAPAERPQPAPDRFGRMPGDGSVVRPAAERIGPERPAEPTPADSAGDRTGPSFSSLSDALKAAKSPAEQRRSLEQKIADMLENGSNGPSAPDAASADPLAVFAGARAASPGATARGPLDGAAPFPDGERKPQTPSAGATTAAQDALNGRAGPHAFKQGEPSLPADPAREEAASKPAASPAEPTRPGAAAAPSDPTKPEDQRIIAMPSRLPAAAGAGQAAVAPGGAPVNGAAPPAQAKQAEAPTAAKPAGNLPEPPKDTKDSAAPPVEARRPAPSPPAAQHGTQFTPPGRAPVAPTTGLAPRPIPGQGRAPGSTTEAPASQPAARAPGAGAKVTSPAGVVSGLSQSPLQGQAGPTQMGPAASGRSPLPGPADRAAPREAAPVGAPPLSEAAKVESALADLLAQSQERASIKPPPVDVPSEALIDAVVDLVHKEPASMSVFTSGSAFIHGVGGEASKPVDNKPASAPGSGEGNPNAAADNKLDRSAAELLRPMLRQWLAENMPRIVEEALRSELVNSQGGGNDPKKV